MSYAEDTKATDWGGNVAAARVETPGETFQNRLEKTLAETDALLASLEDRLSSVLLQSYSEPAPMLRERDPEPESSDVVRYLRSVTEHAESINRRIDQLRGRVDI